MATSRPPIKPATTTKLIPRFQKPSKEFGSQNLAITGRKICVLTAPEIKKSKLVIAARLEAARIQVVRAEEKRIEEERIKAEKAKDEFRSRVKQIQGLLKISDSEYNDNNLTLFGKLLDEDVMELLCPQFNSKPRPMWKVKICLLHSKRTLQCPFPIVAYELHLRIDYHLKDTHETYKKVIAALKMLEIKFSEVEVYKDGQECCELRILEAELDKFVQKYQCSTKQLIKIFAGAFCNRPKSEYLSPKLMSATKTGAYQVPEHLLLTRVLTPRLSFYY